MIYDNINIIVALTNESHSIGYRNKLLFNIPKDMERFKAMTTGNTIVCGMNTYKSFPKRPLKNRKNIVLTRDTSACLDGALVLNGIADVLKYSENNPDEKIFICGGEQIYKEFIKYSKRMYLTYIFEEPILSDTYFPMFDISEWEVEKSGLIDEYDGTEYLFLDLIK